MGFGVINTARRTFWEDTKDEYDPIGMKEEKKGDD